MKKQISLLTLCAGLLLSTPAQAGLGDIASGAMDYAGRALGYAGNAAGSAFGRSVVFVGDHPIVFGSLIPLFWFGVPQKLVKETGRLIKSQETTDKEGRELVTALDARYGALLKDTVVSPETKVQNIKQFAANFQRSYREQEANFLEKFHSNVTATYNKLSHYPLVFLAHRLAQDIEVAQWYANNTKVADTCDNLKAIIEGLQAAESFIRTTDLFAQEQSNVIQEKNRSYINVPVFIGLCVLGLQAVGGAYEYARLYHRLAGAAGAAAAGAAADGHAHGAGIPFGGGAGSAFDH